jgi:apolipoprotein N-acyltransferase
MRSRTRLVLLAAAGGVLGALCWLPFHLAPWMPLAFLPAMRGFRLADSPREAVYFGLAFGVGFYTVAGHYVAALVTYSWIALVLYAIQTLYFLPFVTVEAWGAYWIERRVGLPRTFGFALLHSLFEWTRTLGDLTDPADMYAHAFGTHPAWLVWSSWTGPYFVSLMILIVAALLELAVEWRGRPTRAAGVAAIAAILWLAPPVGDLFVAGRAPEHPESIRVGIVQPSISVKDKLDREQWPVTWGRLEDLSREAARGADLVLWPESARPGPVLWRDDEPFSDPRMEELARELGVPILYGCEIARVVDGDVVALYNGAALARADGLPGDWYGKQQLLPFVEGVPYADLLGWDPAKARRKQKGKRSYLTLAGNFSPGPRSTVFEVGPARIGVLICYEGFYPQLVRRYSQDGANALCVMTNDAWWGYTVFAPWHARMISARAREAGVPVVRAANSGVSSITDRFGRMGEATDLFEVTTLQVDLAPSPSGPTLYERWGNVYIWIGWLTVAILVVVGWRRGRP